MLLCLEEGVGHLACRTNLKDLEAVGGSISSQSMLGFWRAASAASSRLTLSMTKGGKKQSFPCPDAQMYCCPLCVGISLSGMDPFNCK